MRTSAVRWVLPMALFVLGTVVEGKLPTGVYPLAYAIKIAVVCTAAVACARSWIRDIRLDRRAWMIGTLAGVLGIVAWLAIEAIPYPRLGARVGFNPFAAIADPTVRAGFLAVRFLGLAVLVPVIEEVFWRGFALRFATDTIKPAEGGWQAIPIGLHSVASSAIVSAVFGLSHPEWLAGTVYAFALSGVLARTRSLGACVVAHGVTNLLLGIWVVVRKDWILW